MIHQNSNAIPPNAVAQRNINATTISQQQKRPRAEDTLPIPSIQVNNDNSDFSTDEGITPSPSMETIIQRRPKQRPMHQLTDRNAILHDRLLDKIDRYKSHNEFLTKCVTNKVIPFLYRLTVEPSIGNHDDNFLKGYYDEMGK